MHSETNAEQPQKIKTAEEIVKEDEIIIAKLLMDDDPRAARDYLTKLGFTKEEIKEIEAKKLVEKKGRE